MHLLRLLNRIKLLPTFEIKDRFIDIDVVYSIGMGHRDFSRRFQFLSSAVVMSSLCNAIPDIRRIFT